MIGYSSYQDYRLQPEDNGFSDDVYDIKDRIEFLQSKFSRVEDDFINAENEELAEMLQNEMEDIESEIEELKDTLYYEYGYDTLL